MSPGPPLWKQWIIEHFDPLTWTFLAFTIATLLLLAWGIGYEMGRRRRAESRPVFLPDELVE